MIHFLHRAWAVMVVFSVWFLNLWGLKECRTQRKIVSLIYLINILVCIQIILGISTVLSIKSPIITSCHVVTGAAILGVTWLLILRTAPLSLNEYWEFSKELS